VRRRLTALFTPVFFAVDVFTTVFAVPPATAAGPACSIAAWM
jgi:hypothetical protein